MEPTNHPSRKENDLPNLNDYGTHVNLRGCSLVPRICFESRAECRIFQPRNCLEVISQPSHPSLPSPLLLVDPLLCPHCVAEALAPSWRYGDSPWKRWKKQLTFEFKIKWYMPWNWSKMMLLRKGHCIFCSNLLVLGYQHLLLTKFQREIFGLDPPAESYCRIFAQISDVVPSFYFANTYHP